MPIKKFILRATVLLAVVMSLTVLYGWIQNISIYKTLLPGRPDMKANAAVFFLCISIAFLLSITEVRRAWRRYLGSYFVGFTFIFSTLILCEYIFSFDSGIDEFLFLDPNGLNGHSPPGRFSPVTAINFILLSLGILFDILPPRPWYRLSQLLLMLCFLNSLQSFLGSAIGISHIFGMDQFLPMALHTAFSFTILSAVFLTWRSHFGLMERFTSETASALMARRMLIAALLISPCLKAFSIFGVNMDWFSQGDAQFIQSMGTLVFMGLLVVVTAGALLRNEREQNLARKVIERSRYELEKAKDEAEAASLAKSQFLANMSHEIRTPLGIILGFSELGLESLQKPEEAANYLRSINRNANELSKLLGEILDLSKVEANKLEAEKINFAWLALVEDVCNLLRVKANEKGIELKLNLQMPLPSVIESDPTRLRQILINLIGNAIKFTNQGSVDVTVSATMQSQDFYQVRFEIEDSGIGISEEQKDFLFKPFSQADSSMTRKFGGTGLGLVLSKQLAVVLGGDLVLVRSEPNRGSTFACTLRTKVSDEFIKTNNDRANQKSIDLSALHILLAEDSIDNQVLINHYLRSSGAKLSIANNGLEAVQKNLQEQFDVVLMDIQMPVMDGFKALTELRAQGYKRPVIAVTAHAMKEEQERAFQAGFNNYLTKPLNKNLLLNVLEKIAVQKSVQAEGKV
ncbi:MAG: response regulator [Bdellovibrionaceae bacterium]|nr:response regulator [Bdellovibrio sp.]